VAGLKQLDFGGWDIFEDNAYEAAKNAKFSTRSAPQTETLT
jgi:hypothetical protein